MNAVTCALDHVMDDSIQNEKFQQEMVDKFSNLNFKFDILQSTNMQLQTTNSHLTSKVDYLESEITAMRKENKEYSIQMQTQNKGLTSKMDFLQNQNMDLTSKMDFLQNQNTDLTSNMDFLQNKNKDLTSKVNSLQNQNKKFIIANSGTLGRIEQTQIQDKLNDYQDFKDVEKRLLVSEPNSLELQVQDLNAKVDSLQQQIQHANHGNIYTRWGRMTCPNVNGTDLVYSGYSGGSWWEHTGAASNYLCMPKDPEFLSSQLYTPRGAEGFVYGVEYEEKNFNGANTMDHDAPCVVCKSERAAIMMIPARQHCDRGWTKEYSGFLVSGAYAHKAATEYVCLDATPETEEHDISNNNGALFYYVFSKCGSLPCSPYKENGPLPCVVCSQ